MNPHPPRPQGAAPFALFELFEEAYCQNTYPKGVSMVTAKLDGMQLNIQRKPGEAGVTLYTKADNLCTTDSKGILKIARTVYDQQFSHLDPRKVKHPVYGAAVALHCELFIHRKDRVAAESAKAYAGELQDLASLMYKAGKGGHSFGLRIFRCSFSVDDSKRKKQSEITWAERLALCVAAFGPDSVVPVFLDVSQHLNAKSFRGFFEVMEEAYRFIEGFVYEMNGKVYKVKSVRPVCLLLLAVGFTFVQGKLIPSHFVWGVRDEQCTKTSVVLLVEDMEYLFDDNRSKTGKIQLSVKYVVNKNGRYSYEGDRPTYFGDVLNAHFRMMPEERFVYEKFIKDRLVEFPDGRRLVVASNRSMRLNGFSKLMVLPDPELGALGCEQFWMTGASDAVGGVHLQAARLVATKDYGHEVFQALLERGPTSAESLVKISTTMSRDLREHALEVYGPKAPDLIHGKLFEDMQDSSCGYDTTDRSQDYSQTESQDYSQKVSDEEDQPPKKCARVGP